MFPFEPLRTPPKDGPSEEPIDQVSVRCKCGILCVRSLLHSDHRWVHEDDTIRVSGDRIVGGPMYDHEPVLDVIEATATIR